MTRINSDTPLGKLGLLIRQLRERQRQSLSEVSQSVEIDVSTLAELEGGKFQPGKQLLALLIEHFDINNKLADELWRLAGFTQDFEKNVDSILPANAMQQMTALLMLPMDSRIVYTDTVHVVVNNYGVVMEFMQSNGQNQQSVPVARVGMSKEHAKSVLEVLKQTLSQSDNVIKPKLLPPKEDLKK